MNRKEILEQEYNARTGRTRLESALPPANVCRPRRNRGIVCLLVLLLVVAGVAGWLICGGK